MNGLHLLETLALNRVGRCERALIAMILTTLVAGCASRPTQDALLLKEMRSTSPLRYDLKAVAPRSTEDIAGLLKRYEGSGDRPWESLATPLDEAALERSTMMSERYVIHGADSSARNGRYRQYLNNWRLAVDAAKGSKLEYFRAVDYAYALSLVGSAGDAIKARDDVISSAQGDGGSAFVGAAYLLLASRYAELGDLKTAKHYIEKAVPLYGRAQSSGSGTLWYGDMWEAELAFYQALISKFEGNYEGARRGYLNAMDALDRDIVRATKRKQSNVPGPALSRLEEWRALMHAHLAQVLAKEGRFSAAELEMREGLIRSLRYSGDRTPNVAALLTQFSRIVLDQGRYSEALALAQLALMRFERGGAVTTSSQFLDARRAAARAHAALGQWDAASIQYNATARAVALDPSLRGIMVAEDVDFAMAMIRTGAAWRAYDGVRRHAERLDAVFGANHFDVLEARCVTAMALAQLNKAVDAFKTYQRCMPGLRKEALRRELLAPQRQRFHQILEAYIELLYELRGSAVLREAKIDAAEEAFLISDLIRKGTLQKSLLYGVLRSNATDRSLVSVLDHEHESARAVQVLESQLVLLLSAAPEERNRELETALRNQLDSVRRVQTLAHDELLAKMPLYARLVEASVGDLGAVRRALREDQVLVAMLAGEKRLFLWCLGKQGELEFRAMDMGAGDLERRVDKLRTALDLQRAPIEALPEFDMTIAHELFTSILGPLTGWKTSRTIVFLPHGALKSLPIDLLPTQQVDGKLVDERVLFDRYKRVPWLARTHSVVQLPALDLLTFLHGLVAPIRGSERFAGIADPVFSGAQMRSRTDRDDTVDDDSLRSANSMTARNLKIARVERMISTFEESTATRNSSGMEQIPPLPETRDEVVAIAQILGARQDNSLFMGSRASETTVKSGVLRERQVVVFATHGLVAGELDGLSQPALALANPSLTGETGEDGLLTMSEVFGLQLKADMVILSACNTAAGENQGGEAVSGLVRAFLYAGARAALATHWAVESTSASLITTGLFRQLAIQPGISPEEGLRRAMTDLIDSPGYPAGSSRPIFSYAHPVFWSPFSLLGSGN